MRILFAASECVPFIKTGGLADVIGALPKSLAGLSADVRVMLPLYRGIRRSMGDRLNRVAVFRVPFGISELDTSVFELTQDGVTCYFIENDRFFDVETIYGDGMAEGYRFAFFCRAVLEALPRIGFFPDVLHCNDWQTGLIPMLLKTQYHVRREYREMRTVFSIHNLKYQGIFPWDEIEACLGIDRRYYTFEYLEFYGNLSFLKGGLVFADRLLTVSPTYAREILLPYYGELLDGVLRMRRDVLSGILNGIDTALYDPAADAGIAGTYSAADPAGKRLCRRALRAECGLDADEGAPLIAMVTRLTPQKGLDLVARVLDEMIGTGAQFVFLGLGDQGFVNMLVDAERRYPGRVHTHFALDEGLAHRVYAGSDMFLMPSQYEPCGLSQMIALRYGSVPIVRETGGLKDTVQPYNKYTDEGNGFSFANYNAHEMLYTVQAAVRYYRDDPAMWARLMRRGMETDFSWEQSAKEYMTMYEATVRRRKNA